MIDNPIMITVYAIFIFIITTCIGSFLNVVIYRLPLKMSLAFPASHCPTCNHKLKWYDNIPILSWIMLGGKCRYCKCKITPRYLIVELLTGVLSTLIFLKFKFSFTSLFGILCLLVLIPVAFIDIEHLIIPDIFIIILLVFGIASIFLNKMSTDFGLVIIDYKSRLIGALAVVVFLLIILLFEKLFKKELMGGGDIKLLFVSSLLIGWQLLALMVGLSSILASVTELIAKKIKEKKAKKNPDIEIDNSGLFPFGPYLAISFMIAYVFGIELIEAWIKFIAL